MHLSQNPVITRGKAMVEVESQTGFQWVHLCPVCPGCARATCICTHACGCPPIRPAVWRAGAATCITPSLLIKSSLPGNLVAWQHECGSPRGGFSWVQGERKQKEKRKGRSLAPPPALHLSLLRLHSATQRLLSLP